MCRSTNRQVDPEVWFRIVHNAEVGHNGGPVATYRNQKVEIALGPKRAFENGNIGALTRRVAANRVVRAAPPPRGRPKPPKEHKTPRVVEFLRKAIEWKTLIESGKIATQAELAHKEGITRARVTQIMGMLQLTSEIQQQILAMPNNACRTHVSERALRPIENIADCRDQLSKFHDLFV